jgi:hypothetical protein
MIVDTAPLPRADIQENRPRRPEKLRRDPEQVTAAMPKTPHRLRRPARRRHCARATPNGHSGLTGRASVWTAGHSGTAPPEFLRYWPAGIARSEGALSIAGHKKARWGLITAMGQLIHRITSQCSHAELLRYN